MLCFLSVENNRRSKSVLSPNTLLKAVSNVSTVFLKSAACLSFSRFSLSKSCLAWCICSLSAAKASSAVFSPLPSSVFSRLWPKHTARNTTLKTPAPTLATVKAASPTCTHVRVVVPANRVPAIASPTPTSKPAQAKAATFSIPVSTTPNPTLTPMVAHKNMSLSAPTAICQIPNPKPAPVKPIAPGFPAPWIASTAKLVTVKATAPAIPASPTIHSFLPAQCVRVWLTKWANSEPGTARPTPITRNSQNDPATSTKTARLKRTTPKPTHESAAAPAVLAPATTNQAPIPRKRTHVPAAAAAKKTPRTRSQYRVQKLPLFLQ